MNVSSSQRIFYFFVLKATDLLTHFMSQMKHEIRQNNLEVNRRLDRIELLLQDKLLSVPAVITSGFNQVKSLEELSELKNVLASQMENPSECKLVSYWHISEMRFVLVTANLFAL